MLRFLSALALTGIMFACGNSAEQTATDKPANSTETASGATAAKGMPMLPTDKIPFETMTGETKTLADYSGRVLLLVNVASKCGNTPQYAGLEHLYETYKDSGLTIIGFPANNFGGQEPGTDEQIMSFCTTNYNVTFPMMSKVSVKGDDAHPLFRRLTTDTVMPGEITWNFSKFLLDKDGKLIARFDPKTQPESDEVVSAIKKLL